MSEPGAIEGPVAGGRLRSLIDAEDRRLIGAGLLVAALSLAAKAFALVRDAAIAAALGAGPPVDAFFVALVVPVFVLGLVGGSFQLAFVPVYARLLAAGEREAASRLLGRASALVMPLLLLVALATALAAPAYLPHLAPGFAEETQDATARLLLLMVPFVVAGGPVLVWGGVLTAHRRLALPAIAPIVTPIAMTALLVLVGPERGPDALALGAGLGTAIEATILGIALRRLGVPLAPAWPRRDSALSGVLREYSPLFAASLLLGGAVLLDQAMAARLPEGSAAALGFGSKLVLALLHVTALALGWTVLPSYAEAVGRGDWKALRHTLDRHLLLVGAVSVPAAGTLAFASEPIVTLFYERGAFGPEDTRLVGLIQALYLLQLPFYAATTLLIRLASALALGRPIARVAAINLALTVVFNWAFMRIWGVAGIAGSTAIVFAISALLLYREVARRLSAHMAS